MNTAMASSIQRADNSLDASRTSSQRSPLPANHPRATLASIPRARLMMVDLLLKLILGRMGDSSRLHVSNVLYESRRCVSLDTLYLKSLDEKTQIEHLCEGFVRSFDRWILVDGILGEAVSGPCQVERRQDV